MQDPVALIRWGDGVDQSGGILGVIAVLSASTLGKSAFGFGFFCSFFNSFTGVLRALSGKDGSELFTLTAPEHTISSMSAPAVGDIDLDGSPEIVIQRGQGLIAFENDGTFKWENPDVGMTGVGDAAALADLDGDGVPEIIVGASVFVESRRLPGVAALTDK